MSRPTYRLLDQRMRMFLKRHGHMVKARDLAVLLDCSEPAARKARLRYNKRPRATRISLDTAKRILQHGALEPDLRFTGNARNTARRFWEQWQIAELKDRAGKDSLKDIAANIGKTRMACYRKVWRMGIDPLEHTIRRLAWRLTIPIVTVAGWCQHGSGRKVGYRVRHHREGRYVVVHRDDAAWLLEHVEQARRGEFEDHPGKLHEFDLKERE